MTSAPSLPPFFDLLALGSVPSTNDEALARAARGAPEGLLVTARSQSAGRGRRGRRWESPEGNLYLSLVLTPPAGRRDVAAAGFAGALAAADGLSRFVAPARIALKWPNDVLLDDAKVAGLLIEAVEGRDGALVMGIGVNVAAHPDAAPYPATDLAAAGARATVDDVLAAFCVAFERRYRGYLETGFAGLRAAWLARAWGLGRPVTVQLDGRRFDGVFGGLDESGALILHQGAGGPGPRIVTAGDVFFSEVRP